MHSPSRNFNPIYEESKATPVPTIPKEKPKFFKAGKIDILYIFNLQIESESNKGTIKNMNEINKEQNIRK